MASKNLVSTTLLLSLLLIFFTMVRSTNVPCPPPPKSNGHNNPPATTPSTKPPATPTTPSTKPPSTPTTPSTKPPATPTTPSTKPPATPTTPSTKPPATPATPATPAIKPCPVDALKLGACANVLGGLLNPVLGKPPKEPCCGLIRGLVDLDAAVCLCTAVKANILGIINLNIPVDLSLLLNYCGKGTPSGFQCS